MVGPFEAFPVFPGGQGSIILNFHFRTTEIPSSQQGEPQAVWLPVGGQQHTNKQENRTHDKEHDRSLRTDPELAQRLGGDYIMVDIFPNLMRTLNAYPRSFVNPKQKKT